MILLSETIRETKKESKEAIGKQLCFMFYFCFLRFIFWVADQENNNNNNDVISRLQQDTKRESGSSSAFQSLFKYLFVILKPDLK